MAKKEDKPKIEVERTYNIPLRKGFQKAPKYKRAKKAISVLNKFLQRHMKSKDIKIGRYLNEKIWERGMKSPPHHVKVNVTKDSEGVVRAELFDAPKEIVKEKKKGKAEKKKEAKPAEGEIKKVEETEEKEAKEEEKEERAEKHEKKKFLKEERKERVHKEIREETPKAELAKIKQIKKLF